jgi:hypothetical protein
MTQSKDNGAQLFVIQTDRWGLAIKLAFVNLAN